MIMNYFALDSVKPLSVSCTPAKPFGTMPCAPVASSAEITSQKRLSVSAFPPPSALTGAQVTSLNLTEERTNANAS